MVVGDGTQKIYRFDYKVIKFINKFWGYELESCFTLNL